MTDRFEEIKQPDIRQIYQNVFEKIGNKLGLNGYFLINFGFQQISDGIQNILTENEGLYNDIEQRDGQIAALVGAITDEPISLEEIKGVANHLTETAKAWEEKIRAEAQPNIQPIETIPHPNPDPIEVLGYIPNLRENKLKTGWIVGWVYGNFFCTPGVGYSLDSVTGWIPLPQPPQPEGASDA